MRDIVDLQDSDTWKIRLTIANNFISSKDAEKEHINQSRSMILNFASYNNGNEVVDEIFESLCSRFQNNLEISM